MSLHGLPCLLASPGETLRCWVHEELSSGGRKAECALTCNGAVLPATCRGDPRSSSRLWALSCPSPSHCRQRNKPGHGSSNPKQNREGEDGEKTGIWVWSSGFEGWLWLLHAFHRSPTMANIHSHWLFQSLIDT